MPTASLDSHKNIFNAPSAADDDDDDDDGWQDMPVVRDDDFANGMDEEDRKKYHYVPPSSLTGTSGVGGASVKTSVNATGNLIDFDDEGHEWREKREQQNESEYTRLRGTEEDDTDQVHMRTKYLFDEDKAMTPLGQMQTTKNLLTEAQRIAYVGLCGLTIREMSDRLMVTGRKELRAAKSNLDLWGLKIMGRLYYHMELATEEQKMIESLALHGVQAQDLAPALMTTHTVANPEYDPEEARKQSEEENNHTEDSDEQSISDQTLVDEQPVHDSTKSPPDSGQKLPQTTVRVFAETSKAAMPGVTTTLSAADKDVTLDIRWTVLCDLFLVLVADSVYDARSRVLLETVANKLGLGWLDVTKFECRVTEALEIQENVETLEHQELVAEHQKMQKKKRYMMLGLATIGGGLVIGLSAGLLAPVIGAGLGAAFTTIGITGTTGFLAGAGGAAIITTGGVLTGSGIAAKGMANRTRLVRTFNVLPLYNNKRVSCILTVPGFMNGAQDDVRLPFSVLDPVVGDVFSVLWEPEMIRETGSALKILTGEVLSQVSMTVLQATVMTALMSALQWPVILTKLGYLIDNPWNNALDRSKKAGLVLADVLMHRHLGVRPVTLIGFSLGARVIFYALLELAKQKAFGVVQDVFLLGTTLSASTHTWCEARSVVSGRLVNCYARNDWVLNYLFRATSGGVGTVAGLRPVNGVPGMENIDVTDKISGHMSYRTFLPLILDQLGFPVFSDYFDEPVEPDFEGDRIVVREEEMEKKKGWFFSKRKSKPEVQHISRPPSVATASLPRADSANSTPVKEKAAEGEDDLPPRLDQATPPRASTPTPASESKEPGSKLPVHAGFDFAAIKQLLDNDRTGELPTNGQLNNGGAIHNLPFQPPTHRSVSMPLPNDASKGKRDTSSLDNEGELLSRTASVEGRLASLFKQSSTLEDGQSMRVGQSHEHLVAGGSREPSGRPTLHASLSSTPKHADTNRPGMKNIESVWDSTSPSHPVFSTGSAVALASSSMVSDIPDGIGKPALRSAAIPLSSYGVSPSPAIDSPLRSNLFAPPAFSSTPSSAPGLSFGGNDGSITPGSFGFTSTADPWSSSAPSAPPSGGSLGTAYGKKRTQLSPGLDPNPWS